MANLWAPILPNILLLMIQEEFAGWWMPICACQLIEVHARVQMHVLFLAAFQKLKNLVWKTCKLLLSFKFSFFSEIWNCALTFLRGDGNTIAVSYLYFKMSTSHNIIFPLLFIHYFKYSSHQRPAILAFLPLRLKVSILLPWLCSCWIIFPTYKYANYLWSVNIEQRY